MNLPVNLQRSAVMNKLPIHFLTQGLLALSPGAFALDAACEPIEEAGLKSAQQPAFHAVTETGGGNRLEMIALDGVTYMNDGRKWIEMPVQAQKLGKASAEFFSGGAASKLRDCRKLGTEKVDGIATTVYAYKLDTPAVSLFGKQLGEAKTIEGKYYIGKDGLPYAHSFDDTKQRWKYTGVSAPALK